MLYLCLSGRGGGKALLEVDEVVLRAGKEVARAAGAVGPAAKRSAPRLLPNSRRKAALPVTTTNHRPGNKYLMFCHGNR